MRTLGLATLARTLDLSQSSISSWLNAYSVLPGKKDRAFSLPEATTVALFGDLLTSNRTFREARAETVDMMAQLGGTIDTLVAAPQTLTRLDRIVFVRATIMVDGEVASVRRLCTSADDQIRLLGYLASKRVLTLEWRDVAPLLNCLRIAFGQRVETERELV